MSPLLGDARFTSAISAVLYVHIRLIHEQHVRVHQGCVAKKGERGGRYRYLFTGVGIAYACLTTSITLIVVENRTKIYIYIYIYRKGSGRVCIDLPHQTTFIQLTWPPHIPSTNAKARREVQGRVFGLPIGNKRAEVRLGDLLLGQRHVRLGNITFPEDLIGLMNDIFHEWLGEDSQLQQTEMWGRLLHQVNRAVGRHTSDFLLANILNCIPTWPTCLSTLILPKPIDIDHAFPHFTCLSTLLYIHT